MFSWNNNNQVVNESPIDFAKCSELSEVPIPVIVKKSSRMHEHDHLMPHTKEQLDSLPPITSSRSDQNILLYFVNVIFTFVLSFQNVLLVFNRDEVLKGYFSIGMMVCTISISIFTTAQLCKDKWKIFNIYILLDNIFLAQVASSFGFVGLLMVTYTGYWYQMIAMIAFPIEIIFFVGNFRILMLHVQWSKWRIILYKLVLLADSAAFFQIGAYYMTIDFQYTSGLNPELDGKVKDFVLLYVFGLFALFVELYTKMSDIDQTADLKFDYAFKEMEEAKKIQKIRRSVMGMNIQMEAAKSKFLEDKKRKSLLHVEMFK